jgi:DNA-binding MarR family transcriptional regulator
MSSRRRPPRPDPRLVAQRLHAAAIHLLRRLRVEDQASGLTAPRLSALSVVVFAGPIRMGDLAAAEQVRPPTISRLVKEMERDGLVRRLPDPGDERVQQVQATAKGRRVLEEGRRRRVHRLASDLADLPPRELKALARGAELLDRIARREPGQS